MFEQQILICGKLFLYMLKKKHVIVLLKLRMTRLNKMYDESWIAGWPGKHWSTNLYADPDGSASGTVGTLVDKILSTNVYVPHVPEVPEVPVAHEVHSCRPMFVPCTPDPEAHRKVRVIILVDQCFSGTQADDRSNSTSFFFVDQCFYMRA